MQTTPDFKATLVLKDYSNSKTDKSDHGRGNNAHPNVRSKNNK